MDTELGLRERKKQQTRQAIAETAVRLFAQRGFDAVTVAQVARAADVSEATVFNYFPTKESLFFGQMQRFEETLVEAVRERPPGESFLGAFRRFIDEGADRLAIRAVGPTIATAARIIEGSATLRSREREIIADATDDLAALIAKETGGPHGDLEPWVVANALMGVHQAIVSHVRVEATAGRSGPALAAGARAQLQRMSATLERGLGDYGVRPA